MNKIKAIFYIIAIVLGITVLARGFFFGPADVMRNPGHSQASSGTDYLLLENGDKLLLENGDKLYLE
jgi:hypothetical protein